MFYCTTHLMALQLVLDVMDDQLTLHVRSIDTCNVLLCDIC